MADATCSADLATPVIWPVLTPGIQGIPAK
jgi:hypothetical protein